MSYRGLSRIPPAKVKLVSKEIERIVALMRARRQSLGLTQESLAETADISVGMIRQIEIGLRIPSLPLLIQLGDAMDLKITLK